MKFHYLSSTNKISDQRILRIVQLAAIGLFLGRGLQHLFWDAPFRTFLWDEAIMSDFVKSWLSMSWEDYVRSPEMDENIQNLIKGFGFFYVLMAILSTFIKKVPKFLTYFLWAGSASLIVLALLYMKNAFFSTGQFFEYSLQFLTPVFLFLIFYQKISKQKLLLFFKIAIAFTFVCHGLYAVGYYPRPFLFVQMSMRTFGLTDAQAAIFLDMAGYLDFVVAVLIFVPGRIAKWALAYCVFWGFLTTFARIVGNFYPEFWMESLSKWTPESLYRFPHFLIPLAALILQKQIIFSND